MTMHTKIGKTSSAKKNNGWKWVNDRDPQTLKVEGLCSNNSSYSCKLTLKTPQKNNHREIHKANVYETATVKTSITDNYAKMHKEWSHDHNTWTAGAQTWTLTWPAKYPTSILSNHYCSDVHSTGEIQKLCESIIRSFKMLVLKLNGGKTAYYQVLA